MAPMATFGVTYPGTPTPTDSSHSWTKWSCSGDSRLDASSSPSTWLTATFMSAATCSTSSKRSRS